MEETSANLFREVAPAEGIKPSFGSWWLPPGNAESAALAILDKVWP